jgi:tRNA pseudouridine38-40 synthase
MRYFIELAYRGSPFFGWQRQPDRISVQEALEDSLSIILNTPLEVVGCGRTDTGVHARQYFAHFDFEGEFPAGFLRRINKFIGPDIALFRLHEVDGEAHARFDATHRAYEYHLTFQKDPFRQDLAYFHSLPATPDLKTMQDSVHLLRDYDEFFPFCKSDSDVKTLRCDLRRAEWEVLSEQDWVFHIAADRFLRGMVRLIVGMSLNVGLGKIRLEEVREAMDNQKRLRQAQSAPPHGLYLTEVRYPFLDDRT